MDYKRMLLFLMLGLFFISFASAEVAVITQENDTSVEYKIDNGWFEWLPDWLGGETVAIFTKDYSESSLTKSKAGGHGEFFEEHQLVDAIDFYGREGNSVDVDMKDVILRYAQAENVTYQIPAYEEVCETIEGNTTNGTSYEQCYSELTGYVEEVREEWNWKIYNGEDIIGKFKWELTAIKPLGMDVDWVLTIFGVELLRWDWWDTNWQFKREITNLNGSISALYYINSTILSGENLSTVRFIDYATETIELDYDIAFQNSTHIGVRLNNYQANKVYIYYGNNVAADNSNATAVYLSPIIGYYFDINADDFTGNNDGTTDGVSLIATGYIDGAYDFDKNFGTVGSSITISSAPTLDGDFSYSWWMKPTQAFTTSQTFWDESAGKRFSAQSGNFQIDDGVGPIVFSSISSHVESWKNYILTREGNDYKLFVNGVQTGGTQNQAAVNFQINGIGRKSSVGTSVGAFDGPMDEIYIYNYALNATEIGIISNQSEPSFIFGDEEELGPEVDLIEPDDLYFSTEQNINFQCNTTFNLTIANLTLVIDGTDNYTNATTGLNISINQTVTLAEGNHNWTCRAETVSEQITTATTRFLSIDTVDPALNITSPLATYNLLVNKQTLNLNWTVNDTNLDSCWYVYNGSTNALNCSDNTTSFIYEANQNSLTFYGNDTFGNEGSLIYSWVPKVTEISQLYNNETIEGQLESFSANITLGTGEEVQQASLNYNGTSLSPTIVSTDRNRIFIVNDYQIPDFAGDTNVTFYWEITLTDLTEINLSSKVQLIQTTSLDNCSVNTFELFNVSLFDEKFKTPLNGTIEVIYEVLNTPSYDTVNTLSGDFENVESTLICSNINLTDINLAYSTEIRYEAPGYAAEFYYIQKADITGEIVNVSLFDLNLNESTDFTVSYKNNAFIFIDGAVIQLQRKYIGEDVYETVEAPLTGNAGKAVLHIDLNTYKYRASVAKDGETLDFFDNIVFECGNELAGDCTHSLDGTVDPNNDVPISTITDFSYSISIDEQNKTITVLFAVPSGTPSTINVLLEQRDMFGNSTNCNRTVITSAGSITCDYADTIEKSILELSISKDGVELAVKGYVNDPALDMDGMNFFIIFLFMLSLVGMAISSPEWMVLISVMVLIISGTLLLVSGMSLVMGLGSIAWLVVAAAIILFKMAKQEDK